MLDPRTKHQVDNSMWARFPEFVNQYLPTDDVSESTGEFKSEMKINGNLFTNGTLDTPQPKTSPITTLAEEISLWKTVPAVSLMYKDEFDQKKFNDPLLWWKVNGSGMKKLAAVAQIVSFSCVYVFSHYMLKTFFCSCCQFRRRPRPQNVLFRSLA